jgi:hypothetical protein
MPQPDDAPGTIPSAHAADRLPRHTTPTWEVELLISGVAVFAMLQLPGWLDDNMFALVPRLGAAWGDLLKLLYIYARSAAMILGATFVIHLLLRARWIALVGMHSVYPDGIRWERLRMGPLQRRVESDLDRGSEAAIEAADNGATTVFAIGVVLAIMIAIIAGLLLVVISTLTWVAQALGLSIDPYLALLALFALLMVPFAIIVMADRRYGAHLPAGGAGERMLAAGLRFYARIGLGRGRNRIMALLGSHLGERKVVMLTMLVMAGTLFAAIAWYDTLRHHARFGSYALFPDAGDTLPMVDAAHYDDQRDPARDPAVPFVQGAVVTGPYLRLVVPYQPRRDTPALQRDCAAADDPAAAADAKSTALLQCLQRLHPASLDGKPLAGLRYEVGSDARTDRPALVAMIDVRGLAHGRHELQLVQPPQIAHGGSGGKADAATDTVVRIPFWR